MTDQPIPIKKEADLRNPKLDWLLLILKGYAFRAVDGQALEENRVFTEIIRRAELSEKTPSRETHLQIRPDCSISIPLGDIEFLTIYSEYRRVKIMKSTWGEEDEKTFQEMKLRYHQHNLDLITG